MSHQTNAKPKTTSALWVPLSEAEAETIQGGGGILYPVIVRFDAPKKTS
jgi:hypothetical protein